MMGQHEYLELETQVPQWPSAIFNLLFTPTFLTVTTKDNCAHLLTELTCESLLSFNGINFICRYSAVTSQNVCCENNLLRIINCIMHLYCSLYIAVCKKMV